MEQKSISVAQKASGVTVTLTPLARAPPIRWVVSALRAVYDGVSRIIDVLEMGNLIEELNEYSLRGALKAVGIDAYMSVAVESASKWQ